MRSQLRFVMHTDDEEAFAAFLLEEESVRLIDGPRWTSKSPPTFRTLAEVGWYCIIWSPEDFPQLKARYIPECHDWYCESEYATIQFLRSQANGSSLAEGRIAVNTDAFLDPRAKQVDARFSRLRRFLKKHYVNSIARWYNRQAPIAPPAKNRSANPGDPDPSLWVGPAALRWLQSDKLRRITQGGSNLEAFLEPGAD